MKYDWLFLNQSWSRRRYSEGTEKCPPLPGHVETAEDVSTGSSEALKLQLSRCFRVIWQDVSTEEEPVKNRGSVQR